MDELWTLDAIANYGAKRAREGKPPGTLSHDDGRSISTIELWALELGYREGLAVAAGVA